MRRIPARAILIAGWIVLVLYAYPGVMTMDSFDQLHEGRTWFFTDAHPPMMAAMWGVLDRIVAGPILMLLVQSGAFLAGLFAILRRALPPRAAALTAVAILLFPPVLAPMAVIWKDCQMAGFLALGIAAVLAEDRRWKLAGLALLSLATAMRYNAPAATFPVILLGFTWRPRARAMAWYARYPLALGAWLVVTLVAMGANSLLVDREMHFWHSSLALEDIVGTLAHTEPDLPDAELAPLLAPTGVLVDRDYHARLRARYVPYDFQQLVSGEGHLWDVPLRGTVPAPLAQRQAIERAWKAIVPTHLGAYAAYRADVMADVIGLRRKFQGATVIRHNVQYAGMMADAHIPLVETAISRNGEDAAMWVAKRTRWFRPHVYILLAVGLLLLCRRQLDVAVILLSGLGLEVSLIPLVQAPDYRYSHWLVTCTCVGLVMLFARRLRDIGGA
ncbi:MAG: hypothetical protein ABJE66_05350 [Deltaproteobacteria bacterium]